MNPRPDLELLEDYLEGELSPEDALALEVRLKTEPRLAEQLIALCRNEASLSEWSRAMVVAVRHGYAAGSNGQVQVPAASILPLTTRRLFAAAAAGLAVAAAILIVVYTFFSTPAVAPSPGDIVAQLDEIQGEVVIISSMGETRAAHVGDTLLAGQEVRTNGDGSFATVRYPDGTLIELSTETRVRLLPDGGPGTGKQLFLVEGVVNADVATQPSGRPMIVTTPHAVIRVLGTRFSSAALPESTRIELEEGKVQMIRKSDGQAIEVEEGRYAIAGTRDEPAPAQIEPFTPQLLPPRITQARAMLPYNAGPVMAVAISPNGRMLAAAGSDGSVTLWDMDALEVRLVLKGHTKKVRSLAFSADSKLLATGGEDRLIKVWEVEFGQERYTLPKQKLEADAVAFSPDNRLLVTGAGHVKQRDGAQLRLWNAQTGESIAHVPGQGAAVTDLAFSPDGRTLATASKDGIVRLWDTATWKERGTLQGHHDPVYCVAFSLDGRRLASGGHDRTVILWDVDTQKPVQTIRGHSREVRVVAFSPDGLALATGATDGTARLWDLRTGQQMAMLKAHKFAVTGVAFSPDGQMLATCGWDRTVKVWDLAEPVIAQPFDE